MLRWGSLTSVDPPSGVRGAGRTAIVRSGQVQRDLVRACIKSPCGAPSWKAALEGGLGVCTVAPGGAHEVGRHRGREGKGGVGWPTWPTA
jgi:hypothetical protein